MLLDIDDVEVLSVKGVRDGAVTVGIRPEGFILDQNGPFVCELQGVEVTGRDVSIVSKHGKCHNTSVRSIVLSDGKLKLEGTEVRFTLNPAKVFLFDKDTEESIDFPEV